jgi:hypothetical protein
MSSTTQKALYALIALIVIIGAVVLLSQKRGADPEDIIGNETRTEQTITARVLNESGSYTIAGEAQIPSPCHDLEVKADTTDKDDVVINFDLIVPDEEEMCAQVVSSKEFRVTFRADEDADIRGIYTGSPVTLNLIPVESGEELGEAEYKG